MAVWYSPEHFLRLSAHAAGILHEAGEVDLRKLEPLRTCFQTLRRFTLMHEGSKEYSVKAAVNDPVSGGATAILHMVTNHYAGIAQLFYNPVRAP